MSKLNTAKRKSLPTSEFALPGERKYPVENASHAANAKARATQAVKAGRMSSATKSKIDRKADAVLGKGHKQVKNARTARRAHV
jgi:hypothetical protein